MPEYDELCAVCNEPYTESGYCSKCGAIVITEADQGKDLPDFPKRVIVNTPQPEVEEAEKVIPETTNPLVDLDNPDAPTV